jgi:hypothetical protein
MPKEIVYVPFLDKSPKGLAEQMIQRIGEDRQHTVDFLSATGLYIAEHPKASLKSFLRFLEEATGISVRTFNFNSEPKKKAPAKKKAAPKKIEEPAQMKLEEASRDFMSG